MEMCYDGALVPSSYAIMDEEEIMYVEGGALSKADKALIIGICAASAVALTVALVYGQLALAAAVVGCITATLVFFRWSCLGSS